MVHDVKRRRRIVACIAGLPLLALLCATAPPSAQAKKYDYSFDAISTLGDTLPGTVNDTFVNDYEPAKLTNNGDLIFGADVSTGGEGIFILRNGEIEMVTRTGDPAPGTDTDFALGCFSRSRRPTSPSRAPERSTTTAGRWSSARRSSPRTARPSLGCCSRRPRDGASSREPD